MIFKLLLIGMTIIGIFMYLIILGVSKNKTYMEIKKTNEEEINYLKNIKNRK